MKLVELMASAPLPGRYNINGKNAVVTLTAEARGCAKLRAARNGCGVSYALLLAGNQLARKRMGE